MLKTRGDPPSRIEPRKTRLLIDILWFLVFLTRFSQASIEDLLAQRRRAAEVKNGVLFASARVNPIV
jgi:hypothetical protein